MRVILCGGGTAGHVTPAIAIAEGILAKIPDAKILFVGREGGEENQAVKNKGFELRTVKICGFERKINHSSCQTGCILSNVQQRLNPHIFSSS